LSQRVGESVTAASMRVILGLSCLYTTKSLELFFCTLVKVSLQGSSLSKLSLSNSLSLFPSPTLSLSLNSTQLKLNSPLCHHNSIFKWLAVVGRGAFHHHMVSSAASLRRRVEHKAWISREVGGVTVLVLLVAVAVAVAVVVGVLGAVYREACATECSARWTREHIVCRSACR
jgi:hypothetical protein